MIFYVRLKDSQGKKKHLSEASLKNTKKEKKKRPSDRRKTCSFFHRSFDIKRNPNNTPRKIHLIYQGVGFFHVFIMHIHSLNEI